jgi:hypothetical protein
MKGFKEKKMSALEIRKYTDKLFDFAHYPGVEACRIFHNMQKVISVHSTN